MSEHTNNTQAVILPFLEALEAKIEQVVMAENGTLPVSKTAKEMAPNYGWDWMVAYQLLRLYVGARPELEIAGGPKGGVRKRVVKV